jgi:hypothetical protein
MSTINPLDASLPVWKADDGSNISCTEKVKVLNENCHEFRQVVLDLLEDGVLMGCSEMQLKETLYGIIEELKPFADGN